MLVDGMDKWMNEWMMDGWGCQRIPAMESGKASRRAEASKLDLEAFRQVEKKAGSTSCEVPSTTLGRKLVLKKCFPDEFTTGRAFLSEGSWIHFPQPFVSP